MNIIIKADSAREMNYLFKGIKEKHSNKINVVKQTRGELELINGDSIRFINSNSRCLDGLRADVVVGEDTEYITCHSKQEKREWNIADFNRYIETIKPQEKVMKLYLEDDGEKIQLSEIEGIIPTNGVLIFFLKQRVRPETIDMVQKQLSEQTGKKCIVLDSVFLDKVVGV